MQMPQERVGLTWARCLWQRCLDFQFLAPLVKLRVEARMNPTQSDIERYRQNYLIEMDGIALYRSMAAAEKDKSRAEIFEKLAQNEERHAQRWAHLIESAGGSMPNYRPSLRVRGLGWMEMRLGSRRVQAVIRCMVAGG